MDHSTNKTKHMPDKKPGKLFLIFAGLCVMTLPLIIFAALSYKAPSIIAAESQTAVIGSQNLDFDHQGGSVFITYDQTSEEFLNSAATERTLETYYALRQYPGSPPYIPHKTMEADGAVECLTCHANGGWTEELKGNTPVTPHPEHISCRQCHVIQTVDSRFAETVWQSIMPPRLGRSHLPGAPPPIAHDLDMRGDCIACHSGPGAVSAIRSEHAGRGNCRQCHVPDSYPGVFQRKSEF